MSTLLQALHADESQRKMVENARTLLVATALGGREFAGDFVGLWPSKEDITL